MITEEQANKIIELLERIADKIEYLPEESTIKSAINDSSNEVCEAIKLVECAVAAIE